MSSLRNRFLLVFYYSDPLDLRLFVYHNFDGGYLLDSSGGDIFTGQNFSDREYFKEGMKGNTYVSTPAYSDVTKKVSYVVAAPLWEGGIPGTTPVGVITYVPDGEFLNDIIRSI